MNWKKRKKLRKIAHAHGKAHYYEWRNVIKELCHLDLYMTYCREKRSEAWRVLVNKKMENGFIMEHKSIGKTNGLPNFSANDLIEAARNFSEHSLYTDIVNQLVDEKARAVDKIVFDCFQQHLGCKKADDVFVIVTSPVMFHHYNDILPHINEKLAREIGPLGSPSGVCCIEFNKMTEPTKGSREMLEALRTRWEEIYNEN